VRTGLALLALAGCYAGARATRDVNAAWRGHGRAEIIARWGEPTEASAERLVWTRDHRHVALPEGEASLRIAPGELDAHAALRPGEVTRWQTHVVATLDGADRIVEVTGATLRRGPPRGTNLRWGVLLGAHAGMGRLDDTATPLPSGGVYLGGMLARTLGLVGVFELVSGKDDAGGAIGLAAGIATQWWATRRLSVRGGPAAVLGWDPGFEDGGFAPGLLGGVSYAIITAGSFVLDVRLDLIAAPDLAMGSAGVGVNVN
jgi:hypothetical protein